MEISLLLALELGLAQQFEGTEYPVEWCADLMAHGRQEQRLGFVGCIGATLGGGHRCLHLLARTDIAEGAEQHILTVVAGLHETRVQVATIAGLKLVGADRPGFIESLLDPAMVQALALVTLTQPLLGQAVLQHHLAVGTAQHAKGNRCSLDDCPAECLAFDQRVDAPDRRDDQPTFDARYQAAD
ncbi:hypothetical protein D9M71_551400 [compost metagenome]